MKRLYWILPVVIALVLLTTSADGQKYYDDNPLHQDSVDITNLSAETITANTQLNIGSLSFYDTDSTGGWIWLDTADKAGLLIAPSNDPITKAVAIYSSANLDVGGTAIFREAVTLQDVLQLTPRMLMVGDSAFFNLVATNDSLLLMGIGVAMDTIVDGR